MSDILIRGMEMPHGCGECWLQSPTRYCYSIHDFLPKDYGTSNCRKHPKCQLLELPPHGDLIDRRELLSTVMQVVTKFPTNNFAAIEHLDLVSALLRGATVVVPAERSEP